MAEFPDTPCVVCRKDVDDELVIYCDGCDKPYHTYCVSGCLCCKKKPNCFGKIPPVPEGDFFCKMCAGRPDKLEDPTKQLSRVYAFGDNQGGQLGIGEEGEGKFKKTPTLVNDLCALEIVDASLGGWNTLVLTNEGDVYTCGDGTEGKTGHPDVVHEMMPRYRLVNKLIQENQTGIEGPVINVFQGRDFAAAVTKEGHLYTWGNGTEGKLGHQAMTSKKIPTKISALREMEIPVSNKISCGWSHIVCVEKEDGVFMGWGSNRLGQLGAGIPNETKWVPQFMNPTELMDATLGYYTKIPEPFEMGRHVMQVSCGKVHTLALTTSGKVYSWGGASTGQLGHGKSDVKPDDFFARAYVNLSRPKLIEAISTETFNSIVAGGDHSMCRSKTNASKLYTWGCNSFGQLGNGDKGPNVWIPTAIPTSHFDGGGGIQQLSAGDNHSGCTTVDGEVLTWGCGRKGQLGLGQDEDVCEPTPVDIPANSGEPTAAATTIYCGGDHTVVVVRTVVKNTRPKKAPKVKAVAVPKKGAKKGAKKSKKKGDTGDDEPLMKKAKTTATKKKSTKKKK